MTVVWSSKVDEILKIGQPLTNVGVLNWALTKSQAIKVLDQFWDSQIAVLGGDVYENKDGEIKPNYDSWHCDPLDGEAIEDFVKRSIEKAKTYVEQYNMSVPTKTFFVIVPDV